MKHVLIVTFALLLSAWTRADQIVVIAHPAAGFEKLTLGEARQLFMGKHRSLPNDQTAIPLMHKEESPIRVRFDRSVLDRDPKQSRAYWAQMIFTGRGSPPRQIASDKQMKKEVAANPQAIGYIDRKSLDGSVKAVLIVND